MGLGDEQSNRNILSNTAWIPPYQTNITTTLTTEQRIAQQLQPLETKLMRQDYIMGRRTREEMVSYFRQTCTDPLILVETMEGLDQEKDYFYQQIWNQMKENMANETKV